MGLMYPQPLLSSLGIPPLWIVYNYVNFRREERGERRGERGERREERGDRR